MVSRLRVPGPIEWHGERRVVARSYRPGDFKACLAVFDSNVPRFFTPEERGEFASFLRALPGPYLVLRLEDREVVACGGHAVREGAEAGDLCWGMVRRDLHGQGLGAALMRLRIDALRADSRVRHAELNTSQHTVGFYEGLGFHIVGVQPDGYARGLDRYEMRLDFNRSGS
jgi:ribosomal protein S18 acetylase RimI-like enzyme